MALQLRRVLAAGARLRVSLDAPTVQLALSSLLQDEPADDPGGLDGRVDPSMIESAGCHATLQHIPTVWGEGRIHAPAFFDPHNHMTGICHWWWGLGLALPGARRIREGCLNHPAVRKAMADAEERVREGGTAVDYEVLPTAERDCYLYAACRPSDAALHRTNVRCCPRGKRHRFDWRTRRGAPQRLGRTVQFGATVHLGRYEYLMRGQILQQEPPPAAAAELEQLRRGVLRVICAVIAVPRSRAEVWRVSGDRMTHGSNTLLPMMQFMETNPGDDTPVSALINLCEHLFTAGKVLDFDSARPRTDGWMMPPMCDSLPCRLHVRSA